ncbi:hypothetical protein Tco_1199379, partial [Tanacetum coccineum]
EIEVREISIRELRKKLDIALKEKDGIQLTIDKLENASKIPPPDTRKFLPPKPDLSFIEPEVEKSKAKSSQVEPKVVSKNDGAPIIEDWVSDDEEQDESKPKIEKKIVKPSIAKIEFVKAIH